jgi:WD40 repeat protein
MRLPNLYSHSQGSAMRRIRFTIASLLGFVLFTAVALAALRGSTDIWDSGVFGITLALLLISALLAVHRTGVGRAYWMGFAVFGWAYLLMSLVPSIEARLPTTKGLAFIDSKVADRSTGWTVILAAPGASGNTGKHVKSVAFSPQGHTLTTNQTGTVRLWDAATGRLLAVSNGTSENFVRIGHSLLALVLAFLGGCISRWLHASGPPERAQEADVLSPSPSISDGDGLIAVAPREEAVHDPIRL